MKCFHLEAADVANSASKSELLLFHGKVCSLLVCQNFFLVQKNMRYHIKRMGGGGGNIDIFVKFDIFVEFDIFVKFDYFVKFDFLSKLTFSSNFIFSSKPVDFLIKNIQLLN